MSLIPLWAKALIVAALIALASWAAHAYNESLREDGRDEVRAEWSAERAKQTAIALAESMTNAKETQRRLAAKQDAQDEHDKELDAYKRTITAANDSLDGLHVRISELTAAARRGTSNTATVEDREAAGAAAGMLADMLGRADAAAEVYAKFADASRRSGLQCEREADAVQVKP